MRQRLPGEIREALGQVVQGASIGTSRMEDPNRIPGEKKTYRRRDIHAPGWGMVSDVIQFTAFPGVDRLHHGGKQAGLVFRLPANQLRHPDNQ